MSKEEDVVIWKGVFLTVNVGIVCITLYEIAEMFAC